MCYEGKCAHCIPVEYGSLVLGILSLVGTALTMLWSIVKGIIIAVHMYSPHRDEPHRSDSFHLVMEMMFAGFEYLALIAMIIVAVASLIAVVFSTLLCMGVWKRRPGLVLSYFIYGVCVTAVSSAFSVLHLYSSSSIDGPLPGILGILACAVYALCLVMVYQTYIKFQQEAQFKDHIPLVEAEQTQKIGFDRY